MITLTMSVLVITITSFLVPTVTFGVLLFFKLSQLHAQMNSRLDELVKVTRTQALAEGKLAGVVEGEMHRRNPHDETETQPAGS